MREASRIVFRTLRARRADAGTDRGHILTARQHVRGVYRQVIVALLADQVAQTDHFAAVVHAVVIQILKDFPPLELGFVGDISQLLPQALFDHPHKHAVALVFVTLFVAAGKLL